MDLKKLNTYDYVLIYTLILRELDRLEKEILDSYSPVPKTRNQYNEMVGLLKLVAKYIPDTPGAPIMARFHILIPITGTLDVNLYFVKDREYYITLATEPRK